VIVETDGHRTHSTRQAFEEDRLRDHHLAPADPAPARSHRPYSPATESPARRTRPLAARG
jgi:hypothetical protein